MPIYAPGRRDRHNRPLSGRGKRNVVAMLSLTAMVDMFTVLAVFLLQNYNTTGAVIDVSDKVVLPKASYTKELKPSHVLVITKETMILDRAVITTTAQVRAQETMLIDGLAQAIAAAFKRDEEARGSLGTIRDAVNGNNADEAGGQRPIDRRVTVQADKSIDVMTIKKVLQTFTEVGAEINFAVLKDEKSKME
jgi:biopolymer transport protein ExbD